MDINKKILHKFNTFQREVIYYYNFINTRLIYENIFTYNSKQHYIETFNIVPLDYKLTSIDNGVDYGYI